jgi:glycosyltransferase involved in cell wall biosynthesis
VVNKVRVDWRTPEHKLVGNALGYNTHNSNMRKFCQEFMEFDPTAPIAVTIAPADHFVPVPGKFNILFTMWEALNLPDNYLPALKEADVIVVPSRFCRDLFKKYTDKPVELCWEGVDENIYVPAERKWKPGEKFRFLWVGAPNPRKGYPFMLEVIKIFEDMPSVEIYLKTTMPKMSWVQVFVNAWHKRREFWKTEYKKQRVMWWLSFKRAFARIPKPYYADKRTVMGKHKNIIFDTRHLTLPELVNLYHTAHCFVLPSTGEGWGLTLCEAMATGVPCIATPVTGCADFFDEQVGYPLNYDIKELDMQNYKLKAKVYVPDTRDLVAKMMHVMGHYGAALKKGNAASTRVRSKFTWRKSAKQLSEIVRRYQDELDRKSGR